MSRLSPILVLSLGSLLGAAPWGSSSEPPPSQPAVVTAVADITPKSHRGLPLVHEVHPRLLTGGAPTPAGFEALQEAGVRTIISVDAARPDVAMATARGIRYIHLPVGYDGIDRRTTHLLARAIREADGPVYLHCHHGRHRAPAAAAVALRALGRIDASRGRRILEVIGTSRDYPGLHAAVAEAKAEPTAVSDAVDPGELRPVAIVSDLAGGMADLDRIHDRLRLLAKHDWRTPPTHPDLDPIVEAGILTERFRSMAHLPMGSSPDGTAGDASPMTLARSIELATTLEAALKTRRPQEATAILGRISSECRACHRVHRNTSSRRPVGTDGG